MGGSRWVRAGLAGAVMAAVLGVTSAAAAGAAGVPVSAGHAAVVARGSSNTGFDADIRPPDELDLWAPPYVVTGDPAATVTYGERVTLLEVRDGTRALNADPPHTPVLPIVGRWVGVKLRETNTGSADGGVILRVIGTDGQTYYPQDPTMPGCAPRETYPPRSLLPGQTFTGCDAFALPSKVGVRAVTANYGGFTAATANGEWSIVDRRPLAKRLVYVALGDSYSSGEGSGDYDKKPAACHRGADAWPRQVARGLPGVLVMPAGGLIACSGADSAALTGDRVPVTQVDQVAVLHAMRPVPTLITVTIGGNDIGFANILWDCVNILRRHNCITDGVIGKAEAALPAERGTLVQDFTTIREFAPRARLVVVGYPRLFPFYQADVVQTRCHPWLSDAKRIALNKLDENLNKVISEAAAKAGAAYRDVTGALAGHEMCTKQPWLVTISTQKQELGHPVTAGQTAIAKLVFDRLLGLLGG